MKRYIRAARSTTAEYRGYFITYNAYGKEEYTVDVDGDDVWCDTFSEARKVIDDLYRYDYILNYIEELNKKLGT